MLAVTPTRGLAAGAVCAVGAMVGHQVAGGGTAGTAALLMLPVSMLLGALLVRGRVDPARLGALALLSQGAWHGLLMATGAHPPGTSAVAMLTAHLVAAALTTAVATGLDRALLDAARRVVRELLERPVPAAVPVVRHRVAAGVGTRTGRSTTSGAGPRAPPVVAYAALT